MPNNYAGFVDVGFLKKEGAKALGVNPHGRQLRADAVVSWLTEQFSGTTPRNKSVARPVAKLADGIINLSKEDLNHILPPRDR